MSAITRRLSGAFSRGGSKDAKTTLAFDAPSPPVLLARLRNIIASEFISGEALAKDDVPNFLACLRACLRLAIRANATRRGRQPRSPRTAPTAMLLWPTPILEAGFFEITASGFHHRKDFTLHVHLAVVDEPLEHDKREREENEPRPQLHIRHGASIAA